MAALGQDAPNANTAIALAPPLAREFAPLPVEEKRRLRTQGQAEFYAGDYEKMAETQLRSHMKRQTNSPPGRGILARP